MTHAPHILIVGGGLAGLHAGRRLLRRLHRGEAQLTVVDSSSHLTYQPLLAEAAAGNIEPRHTVVPLRKSLPGATVLRGRVTSIDHSRRYAQIAVGEGATVDLSYDILVLAAGSISRVLPIDGLAEHGIGFKTIGEAIHLRNHVLSRLDAAAVLRDPDARRRALTFVFVGGGYAGVEAIAELQDMARSASASVPGLGVDELRWVLVEASDRILPEVGLPMGRYTVEILTGRGIEVRLGTRLLSATDGRITLSDGSEFAADTLVWTAGVTANPLLRSTDLPLDHQGRVQVDASLAVTAVPDAWALGDCAAVPDLTATEPALCAPSAQHAVRQARVLADNVIATLRHQPLHDYRHAAAGSVASLGLYRGVAEVYGIRLRGFPAWFTHRTYHLAKLPTLNRKLRVLIDWTLGLLFRREVVSLDALENPRDAFTTASRRAA